jgi:hypothetical protein
MNITIALFAVFFLCSVACPFVFLSVCSLLLDRSFDFQCAILYDLGGLNIIQNFLALLEQLLVLVFRFVNLRRLAKDRLGWSLSRFGLTI